MRRLALAAAAAAFLGGCGDPLVDGRYRGEPLFSLEGTVIAEASPQDYGWPEGELRISIEWSEWEGDEGRGIYDVEQLETLTSFPAQFRVDIYQPPPEFARFYAPWMPGHEVSVGRPLLYVDEDGDRTLDPVNEAIVGGAFDTVLVHVQPDWEDDEEREDEWGEDKGEDWDEQIWADEPFGDRGLELRYGYQRMYDVEALCEWAEEMEEEEEEPDEEWDRDDFFPPPDEPVYLYVGDVDEELYFDWECDGYED